MLPESRLIPWLAVLGMLSPPAVTAVLGDPCGMVPPIVVARNSPTLVRQGLQRTYVFYKNGIETFVIRPGYRGNADQFGMLVPFPTPPAIRKVPDAVFEHLASAIDPPEVVIDLRPIPKLGGAGGFGGGSFGGGLGGSLGFQTDPDTVQVLREEAVGMYEVVVLQAGSAQALKKWMQDHKYRFPKGMDSVCQDYVQRRWCFVAVRTRVGSRKSVEPKPGMRTVSSQLPPGSEFDGHIQAMGFRFRSRRLELPMRLSVYNGSDLRNVIYVLHDEPLAVNSLHPEFVVRQIPGRQLFANMTQLLPVRVVGAKLVNGRIDIPKRALTARRRQRDPAPVNGLARSLIASDLLSVRFNRLNHPHEAFAKSLTAISERLGLRSPQVERLTDEVANGAQKQNEPHPLAYLKHMTLTVIDGEFPRKVLADANLTFSEFRMNALRNTPNHYHAPTAAPATARTRAGSPAGPARTPAPARGPSRSRAQPRSGRGAPRPRTPAPARGHSRY
ncbi:MAG: DUF2330 domain-containing protein [Planctomycetaceae bacterium]